MFSKMINNNLFESLTTKEEKYSYLLDNMSLLFTFVQTSNEDEGIADLKRLSQLANFTALMKELFDSFSWVGFYVASGNKLYLGPFQGKTACEIIDFGKGVCGTAASKKETIVVKNVHEFNGHIACDTASNSEIVLPLLRNNELWGLLDIDSYNLNNFDETDKNYLEKIVNLFLEIIKFK